MVAGRRIASLSLPLALIVLSSGASAPAPQARPGVPPADTATCPASHPIKANFTTLPEVEAVVLTEPQTAFHQPAPGAGS